MLISSTKIGDASIAHSRRGSSRRGQTRDDEISTHTNSTRRLTTFTPSRVSNNTATCRSTVCRRFRTIAFVCPYYFVSPIERKYDLFVPSSMVCAVVGSDGGPLPTSLNACTTTVYFLNLIKSASMYSPPFSPSPYTVVMLGDMVSMLVFEKKKNK